MSHRVGKPREIRLAGRSVAYALVRSSRKTIGIEVGPDGVKVRAPQRTGEDRIERAVRRQTDWILAKLEKWSARPQRPEPRFETGETFPYLGGALRLTVRDLERGVRTRLRREDDAIIVEVDPQLSGELRAATVKRALKRWFTSEAEALYTPRIAAYAGALGKPKPKLVIREQRARWGSCDSRGVIRMNWRLIGARLEIIDYVCAHEAAHLVEPNHSPAYWRVVGEISPNYKKYRNELRENQAKIPPF